MNRVLLLLVVVGVALADGDRPIDRLPWNASLADAVAESEDRGVPLLLYAFRAGEEGDVPTLLANSKVASAVAGFALYRIDVSKETPEAAEARGKWSLDFAAEAVPAVHLISAKGQWKAVRPAADGKALDAACREAIDAQGGAGVERGFYANAKESWKAGREALAAGDKKTAVEMTENVVKIAENCKRDFRFTAEARKAYDGLIAEGKAGIEELKKAIAAKEWKKVWALGHSLSDIYVLSALAGPLGEALDPAASDPEVKRMFEKFDTDAWLEGVTKHRGEALAVVRTKVPATEVPDDQVTLVFWDEVKAPREFVVVGVWLGKDRAAVFPCDPASGKVIEVKVAGESDPLRFVDCVAKDDVERKAMALVREKVRWESRPVVPVDLKVGDGGKVAASYYDGWDGSCGHWSEGEVSIDPVSGVVEDRGHAK